MLNFFHIKLGKRNQNLEKIFKSKGILFRKGPGVRGFESFSRFSLGSREQMSKVISVIKNVIKKISQQQKIILKNCKKFLIQERKKK